MIILPSMYGIRSKLMGLPPGAIVWLDSSTKSTLFTDAGITQVANDNDFIYRWNDISGNGRHAQQTNAAYRPQWRTTANGINNLSVVNFYRPSSYPNNSYLTTVSAVGIFSNNPRTLFTVQKELSAGSQPRAICQWGGGSSMSNWAHSMANNTIGLGIDGTNFGLLIPFSVSVGSTSVITSQIYNSYPRARKNSGSWTTSATFTSVSNSTLNVGAWPYLSDSCLNNPLCELILYNTNLSDDDCLKVENYLRAKWGF